MSDTIYITIDEGVATLTLNRPDRHNSINIAMLREVYETLGEISYRKDISTVVLTGTGNTFCPGGDIKAIVSGEMAAEMAAGFNKVIYSVPVLLHEMPQVTVAAINGACAGAGLGWACGCDLRYATASAKFTTAFLDRGFAGDMSVPWSLPRIVGPAKARELSFLPDVFDAHEAEAIGLVNAVFDDDDFATEIEAVVKRLRGAKPEAVRALKEHYVFAEKVQFADYAAFEIGSPGGGVDPANFAAFLDKKSSSSD